MQEGLATQLNRKRRTLTKDATCEICGHEEESAYHAVVRCIKPTALRCALREFWDLPDEKGFANTGPDWLLLLLNSVDARTKSRILLLLWRSWHLWNDIIHDQGKATIAGSVAFLLSYAESLDIVRYREDLDDNGKGKRKVGSVAGMRNLDPARSTRKRGKQFSGPPRLRAM
jgi:hypothetical protein